MTSTDLKMTARTLVAAGKGILAADETVQIATKRLETAAILSTPDSRRMYRELFLTTPGISEFISGVILHDETLRQNSANGPAFANLLLRNGILPGIKVDDGTRALAGSHGEAVTEGLDGLNDRLAEYRELGARFAKWRAVFVVSGTLPSAACTHANAHALARYAAMCQEQRLVPIVEPEVLVEGAHSIDRCEEVTGNVLHAVFEALHDQRVYLEAMLVRPNMVTAGSEWAMRSTIEDVATATVRCLRRHVPAAVPGVVFLSGGQDHLAATSHLNAINRLTTPKPWTLTFSYGRALQSEALTEWRGRSGNVKAAQAAFTHRARCCSAAALGRYTAAMEREPAAV
ncbi:MAG TPA: class I fructose-bisphosphate aldolase [Vicinamibacterales bacterium]|nr:class I fructose-bisphosphate aldolase [Vicinamibacterales bacterium]